MSILKRLYASSGPEIIHPVLKVTDGITTYCLTNGWDELVVGLGNDTVVTCTPCGMELAIPARNDDGTQDLNFSLSNVDGQASGFIRAAIKDGREMRMELFTFTSNDLGAPATAPSRFKIKGGQCTATQVSITAGYFNLLDTNFLRNTYNLVKFPGIRYL